MILTGIVLVLLVVWLWSGPPLPEVRVGPFVARSSA